MCSGYNNRLAHLIEAGSDFFLMPSRFEPCGLNQMYSMRYGTPPIVRATGGLLDTVDQYREGTGEGTGFIFDIPSAQALYYTIGWACSTYYDRKDDLHALRLNGMRKDFTWTRSAKKYAEVYKWAVDARRWNRVPRKNTY
jgi:starch synthase